MPILRWLGLDTGMGEIGRGTGSQMWLLCRIGARLCALPLACIIETMRALPVASFAESGEFVGDLSIIRGAPVPVIDGGTLFGEPRAHRGRLVTIDVGGRPVALAVDDIPGVSAIGDDVLQELPPLLRDATADAVHAIGVRDGEFLLRLEASRLVPDGMLDAPRIAPPAA